MYIHINCNAIINFRRILYALYINMKYIYYEYIYIYMRMCVSIRYDSSKMETIIIIFHKALIISDKRTVV